MYLSNTFLGQGMKLGRKCALKFRNDRMYTSNPLHKSSLGYIKNFSVKRKICVPLWIYWASFDGVELFPYILIVFQALKPNFCFVFLCGFIGFIWRRGRSRVESKCWEKARPRPDLLWIIKFPSLSQTNTQIKKQNDKKKVRP